MTPLHGANNVRVRLCEFYHQTIAARILNNITETPQRLIHSFFSRDSEWAVYRCEHTQRKSRHGVITPLAGKPGRTVSLRRDDMSDRSTRIVIVAAVGPTTHQRVTLADLDLHC